MFEAIVKYSTNIQLQPRHSSIAALNKLSYFVVNLDLLVRLSLDEWCKERTGWRRKINKGRRRAEINERDTAAKTVKPFRRNFRTWCAISDLVLYFKSITKGNLAPCLQWEKKLEQYSCFWHQAFKTDLSRIKHPCTNEQI